MHHYLNTHFYLAIKNLKKDPSESVNEWMWNYNINEDNEKEMDGPITHTVESYRDVSLSFIPEPNSFEVP